MAKLLSQSAHADAASSVGGAAMLLPLLLLLLTVAASTAIAKAPPVPSLQVVADVMQD